MQWVTRKLGETFRQGLFFCPPQATCCPPEAAVTRPLSNTPKSAVSTPVHIHRADALSADVAPLCMSPGQTLG